MDLGGVEMIDWESINFGKKKIEIFSKIDFCFLVFCIKIWYAEDTEKGVIVE